MQREERGNNVVDAVSSSPDRHVMCFAANLLHICEIDTIENRVGRALAVEIHQAHRPASVDEWYCSRERDPVVASKRGPPRLKNNAWIGVVGAGLTCRSELVMPVAQALLADAHRLSCGLEAVRFLYHQSHRIPLEIVRKPATSRRG